MIRRLQPEPPKVDTAAQKSDKSKDSTDQESLALEFKKLLERARGGVQGARDEVVALGLALAQAVSTVRTQQQEIHKGTDSSDDSTKESGDFHTEVETDSTVISGPSNERVVVAKCEQAGPQKVDVQDDESDNEGGAFVDGENDQILDQGGAEIVVEDDIVLNEIVDFADEQVVEVGGEEIAQVQTAVAQMSTDGEGTIELDSNFEKVDGELVEHIALNKATKDDEVDDGAAEYYDDEDSALSNFNTQASQVGQSKRPTQRDAGGVEGANLMPASVESDAGAESLIAENGPKRGEFESFWAQNSAGVTRSIRDLEGQGKPSRPESVPTLGADLSFNTFGGTKDRKGDLSLQVTLLRQAYESLRAQTQGAGDVRARISNTQASGIGAATQTRTAEADTAPRQARYLNKATQQRMLDRVETALKEAARTRDGKTISLKLEPVNLGQVKVDVSLRDGALHARVTPQNQEVLKALREHSHELQGALRRLGLNVERVTVQVVGDSFQQSIHDSKGFLDGKSFQGDRNNMPGQERQVPENRFGNEFADVPKAGIAETSTANADHWIA